MITLIGSRSSVIGFGLCGIEDIHEVKEEPNPEEIIKLIAEAENEVIMIDEDVYSHIKEKIKTDKTIIMIPSRYAQEEADDLDILVRDTIGVAIKTN